MTYLGDPVSQLDGSFYAHSNCVAASASELGDSSSLGYWQVSPSRIRKLSGDTSGGISFTDAEEAMRVATDNEVNLTILYWTPKETLDNALESPRIVEIIINCAVTRYTPFRTGTFTGAHAVVVGAKRVKLVTGEDGKTFYQKQAYVMDPGRTDAKWVWWPYSLLLRAAISQAGGNDKIHLMYTRDVEGVSRVAKESGAIRSSTKVTTSPSNKVGTITEGKVYQVIGTVKGSTYTLNGRTLNGWNKLGTNKYCVAKIR